MKIDILIVDDSMSDAIALERQAEKAAEELGLDTPIRKAPWTRSIRRMPATV